MGGKVCSLGREWGRAVNANTVSHASWYFELAFPSCLLSRKVDTNNVGKLGSIILNLVLHLSSLDDFPRLASFHLVHPPCEPNALLNRLALQPLYIFLDFLLQIGKSEKV